MCLYKKFRIITRAIQLQIQMGRKHHLKDFPTIWIYILTSKCRYCAQVCRVVDPDPSVVVWFIPESGFFNEVVSGSGLKNLVGSEYGVQNIVGSGSEMNSNFYSSCKTFLAVFIDQSDDTVLKYQLYWLLCRKEKGEFELY